MKYNTRHHIHYGKKSGFPWCCILYFIFRNKMIKIFFKNDPKSYNDFEYKIWNKLGYKIDYQNDVWSHIACPLHKTANWLALYVPKYYVCKKCNWMQLDSDKCLNCKDKMKE